MSPSRPFVAPLAPPTPDLAAVLAASLFPYTSAHEMPPRWTLPKVRKLRKLFIALLYIGLLASPTFALPLEQPHTTLKENGNKITVKVKGCKPLSHEELRAMLGPAFDEATMAYDDASEKRSMELQQALQDQEDEEAGEGEDVNTEDALEDELKTNAGVTSDKDKTADSTDLINVRDAYFMRRRREAALDSGDQPPSQDRQFLYQNLLHDTVRARSKRSYKKAARVTPWHCKLRKTWRVLDSGYFPKRILDGSCTEKTCFYGMYSCNPVRYTVKVLKKDVSDTCRPVPLVGENTTYEESWVFRREHVVVACECQYAARTAGKRKRTNKRPKS